MLISRLIAQSQRGLQDILSKGSQRPIFAKTPPKS